MSGSGMVLVCALELLGKSPEHMPRIEILASRPPGASSRAAAFVDTSRHIIYLIASAPPFITAQATVRSGKECVDQDAVKMIASIIVHELWHLSNGPDEEGAYYAQLTELQRLGLGPGRWPYYSVLRAMQAALEPRHSLRRLKASR